MPTRWYERLNVIAGLGGLIVLASYGLFEFALNSPDDEPIVTMSIVSAAIALVTVLNTLTVFRMVAKTSPRMAGLISFALLLATAVSSSIDSVSSGPIFFGLWVIAILLSGLFGIVAALITTLSAAGFLAAIMTGAIEYDGTYYELMLLPVSLVLGVISWAGWARITRIKTGVAAITPNKKQPAVHSNLDADVLIASISEGVIVVDTNNVVQVFNQSASTITGWDQNEAIGLDQHSVLMLVDDKGGAISNEMNPISKTLSSGEAHKYDHGRLQSKNQKMVELDLVVSPIKDSNGSVTAAIGIFRDVSKERNEEKQRAEFISTASHEMRTPVAAIEGYLALALNDKVSKIDSSARGYLEKAHVSTQHLGKLFQDLLTAAKSEDGRLTNHPEVVEVGQYLDEIIEGVRFTAEKKGLLMEADFAGAQSNVGTITAGAPVVRPVAYVFVDQERIREVITNLFDNAVKYTEEGKITIGMSTSENEVHITVADTGPGIPKEDVPHLFQKFYRVDNTATRQVGGTGLGLFICRKIVELYNGKIWAESVVGKGSVFYVSLPRLTPEKAQELLKKQAATQSPLQSSSVQTPTPPTPSPAPAATTPAAAPSPAPAPQPAATAPTPAPAPAALAPSTIVSPSPAPATPAPAPTTPAQSSTAAQPPPATTP